MKKNQLIQNQPNLKVDRLIEPPRTVENEEKKSGNFFLSVQNFDAVEVQDQKSWDQLGSMCVSTKGKKMVVLII